MGVLRRRPFLQRRSRRSAGLGLGATPPAWSCATCSMGTLSAIAVGSSRLRIERAADVTLEGTANLDSGARETPLSAIHLGNMLRLTRAGAVVMPPRRDSITGRRRSRTLVDFVCCAHARPPRGRTETGQTLGQRVMRRIVVTAIAISVAGLMACNPFAPDQSVILDVDGINVSRFHNAGQLAHCCPCTVVTGGCRDIRPHCGPAQSVQCAVRGDRA